MNRPKRVVAKPSRYKTTSSEDEVDRRPSKRIPNLSTITDAEIDNDIGDLRRILEDPSTNMDKTNYNIYSQSQQPQQQTHSPQISTNTHTYIEPIPITYPTLSTVSHTQNNDNIIYNLDSATSISTHTHTDGVIFNNTSNAYGTQFQEKPRSCDAPFNNYQVNTRNCGHNYQEGNMRSCRLMHSQANTAGSSEKLDR